MNDCRRWIQQQDNPFLKFSSAHADADEIIEWLKGFVKPPKMIFVTHGEPLSSEALRKRVGDELGWSCRVPDYLEVCDLV